MISLHVYLTAKTDQESTLEAGIRDSWMKAMAAQPGFVSAALLKPQSAQYLDELGLRRPPHTFELVAFWASERARREWVARPIHDQVFLPLLDLSDEVSATVQDVRQDWNL